MDKSKNSPSKIISPIVLKYLNVTRLLPANTFLNGPLDPPIISISGSNFSQTGPMLSPSMCYEINTRERMFNKGQ